MRESLLVEEFEKLRTAKRKVTEHDGVGQSGGSASGTRRTRSQVDPEWTAQDALILVYEISAVEGECADALSTYQKWSIIAENCTALDVARTSSQCRRKWDSLLTEYKMIMQWQKRKKGISFWSLDSGRKKKAGLPLDFTEDLFKAIDEVVKVQEDRSGTDPDTDPEGEFYAPIPKETGSKKLRRQSIHHKGIPEEKDNESTEDELPRRSAPRKGFTKEREHPSMENELVHNDESVVHRSARCKGINKGKEHVSTENQLQLQSTSCQGFINETENVSPDTEAEHLRVSQRAITEETEHIVLENESRCQSTSCIGSTEREHASIDNNSQCQSTPYRGNTKGTDQALIEYESQKVSNPPIGSPEEKEHVSVGNKSCYQLSPGKVIMEQEEHDLLQIIPWGQSTPNEQISEGKEHVSAKNGHSSVISGAEKRKQLLIAKLRENTQLIHTIIAGYSSQKTANMPAGMKYEEALEMKRARQNADKLIACIADLAKNLDLLNNVAEKCQDSAIRKILGARLELRVLWISCGRPGCVGLGTFGGDLLRHRFVGARDWIWELPVGGEVDRRRVGWRSSDMTSIF